MKTLCLLALAIVGCAGDTSYAEPDAGAKPRGQDAGAPTVPARTSIDGLGIASSGPYLVHGGTFYYRSSDGISRIAADRTNTRKWASVDFGFDPNRLAMSSFGLVVLSIGNTDTAPNARTFVRMEVVAADGAKRRLLEMPAERGGGLSIVGEDAYIDVDAKILRVPLAGGEPRTLLTAPGPIGYLHVGSDFLAFSVGKQVYRRALTGTEAATPVGPAAASSFRFSESDRTTFALLREGEGPLLVNIETGESKSYESRGALGFGFDENKVYVGSYAGLLAAPRAEAGDFTAVPDTLALPVYDVLVDRADGNRVYYVQDKNGNRQIRILPKQE